jgi:hypothetical protein
VFDGTFYYFLPWGNSKPCTVVESHWEDICFRLEALNMIQKIIDRLVSKSYHIISLHGVITLLDFSWRYGVHYRLSTCVGSFAATASSIGKYQIVALRSE